MCAPVGALVLLPLLTPLPAVFAASSAATSEVVQQAELHANDGAAGDHLGSAYFGIAVSGTTMVAGAPSHTVGSNAGQGAAYVFSDTTGTWKQVAELTASDGGAYDEFGSSVAISGSTIVVGAGQHEVGSNPDQGAVYVFSRPASGGWANATQTAELTAGDGAANNYLGVSVGVSGTTVAAGATGYLGGSGSKGAVYEWTMPATGGWVDATQTAELTESTTPTLYSGLGYSVSVSGTTIVAGDPYENVGSTISQGAVYVFSEPATDGWVDATQTAELTANNGAADDIFGCSVAMSGSTIAVGAGDANDAQGAVYAFSGSGASWQQDAELSPSATASDGGGVGCNVATSGDTIVAGAPHDTVGSNTFQGRVFVFSKGSSTWSQTASLTAKDGAAGDWFGSSVGISGSTIAVGAYNHQVGANSHQGVVYAYGAVPTQKVSGSVFGRLCGDSDCEQAPVVGGKILVSGHASDGTAISVTATTDGSGAWSVQVPSGTYRVGPTLDGTTFADLPSVDPASRSVTVKDADLTDQNFATCVESGSSDSDTASSRARVRSTVAKPSDCVSQYTVALKASIKQKSVIDPSDDAHFRVTPTADNPGFNDTDYWFTHYLRETKVTRQLASLPTFPECSAFSPARVRELTKKNATIRWFSTISGKSQLGSAKVTFAWNQSKQRMTLVDAPTIAAGTMTRRFRWDLDEPGSKPKLGSCKVTEPVTVMLAPVLSSADGAKGRLDDQSFTVVASWNFPFDPAGAQIDTADTTLAQRAIETAEKISKFIDGHPTAKTAYEVGKLAVEFVTVGKLLHGLKAVSVARAAAFFDGEAAAKAVKTIGGIVDALHGLAHVKDIAEAIGIVGGMLGFGEEPTDGYPLMSAVVRGHFETTPTKYGKVKGVAALVPSRTTLAVSAASTKFPNISMTITRAAADNPNPGIDTYNGVLPWLTTNASNLYVTNSGSKGFGANPAHLINESTEEYLYGKATLSELLEGFKHMLPVQETLREDKELVSTEGFPKEQKLAPAPDCSTAAGNPQPRSDQTICWQFTDGVA